MHEDEFRIAVDSARRLVAEQFPQWAGLAVRPVVADGTVHAIFRIGDGLAARFPLQGCDATEVRSTLEIEAAASAEFADTSTVAAPRPVTIGEPGGDYPLPWAVQTWLPGTVATEEDPSTSAAFARDLAELIAALRAVDTKGRQFAGGGRGGDLGAHEEWIQICLRESVGLLDVEVLARWWARHRGLPRSGADVMTHGDLIPGNVLVADGRLVGVLDTGGFAAADPALELVAAWHLLDDPRRRQLRELLGCGELEWSRGKAWAFAQAMGLVWYYRESAPALSEMGRRTLERVIGEEVGEALTCRSPGAACRST